MDLHCPSMPHCATRCSRALGRGITLRTISNTAPICPGLAFCLAAAIVLGSEGVASMQRLRRRSWPSRPYHGSPAVQLPTRSRGTSRSRPPASPAAPGADSHPREPKGPPQALGPPPPPPAPGPRPRPCPRLQAPRRAREAAFWPENGWGGHDTCRPNVPMTSGRCP